MLTSSQFSTFVRHPYTVQAVQITEENIKSLAKDLGKLRRNDETKERYIQLNNDIVPYVRQAHIGWWVSTFRGDIRCYSPEIFEEQFSPLAEDGSFVRVFDPTAVNKNLPRVLTVK